MKNSYEQNKMFTETEQLSKFLTVTWKILISNFVNYFGHFTTGSLLIHLPVFPGQESDFFGLRVRPLPTAAYYFLRRSSWLSMQNIIPGSKTANGRLYSAPLPHGTVR